MRLSWMRSCPENASMILLLDLMTLRTGSKQQSKVISNQLLKVAALPLPFSKSQLWNVKQFQPPTILRKFWCVPLRCPCPGLGLWAFDGAGDWPSHVRPPKSQAGQPWKPLWKILWRHWASFLDSDGDNAALKSGSPGLADPSHGWCFLAEPCNLCQDVRG